MPHCQMAQLVAEEMRFELGWNSTSTSGTCWELLWQPCFRAAVFVYAPDFSFSAQEIFVEILKNCKTKTSN